MRNIIITLLVVMFMLLSAPVYSHRGNNVDVEILSDSGGKFHVIPYKGGKEGLTHIIKKYLEAKRGEDYSIAIRNKSGDRIGLVIAVDGRNIITGRKSFLSNNEQMYIVDPYGYTKLDGWRTDQNTVHRFYFTDKRDSYAVRAFGDSSAMGVIAVAVFREKERPRILYERQRQEKKAPAVPSGPKAGGSMKSYESGGAGYESDTAGTGFGDKKRSPSVKVQFEPESIPSEKILVKYEWHDVLCGKGILKCRTEEANRLWDEDEYAPYPPGYIER